MARKEGAQNMGGRPSKFHSIDLEQVKILAEKGFTDEEMSEFFKVARKTWHNWKIEHPEFNEGLSDWKKAADGKVERALYERAVGYQHPEDKIFVGRDGRPLIVPTVKHYPPESVAGIFWLKNRRPNEWKDKQEISIPEGLTIKQLIVKPASEKKK